MPVRAFVSIDVPSLIAMIDGVRQAATLAQPTADFLAAIGRANMSRETLSGPNPDIGPAYRNHLLDPEDCLKQTQGHVSREAASSRQIYLSV